MRVIPKLTIDRILLLAVTLSVVYLILYGTQMPDDKAVWSTKRRYIQPGEAFSKEDGYQVQSLPSNQETTQHSRRHPVQQTHHSSFPLEKVRYAEILNPPVHGTNTPRCTNKVRVRALKERCETSPAKDYDFGQGEKQALRYVVVDHDRKLFYCLIGKAGSKSLLQYLVDSKKTDKKGHMRHNDFLEQVGLEMFRNLPLDQADSRFKDYFKFIVVRHPLQRTVSAYYETVVFHEKYRNERGALLNFTEYSAAVTNELMDENPHWRRYINRCKICKLDYDYIMKTETLDDDINDFNDVVGSKQGPGIQLSHENQFIDGDQPRSSHNYKYDKALYALQRKNPEIFADLLNVYGEDMQLFGYKWDWRRGKSSCGADSGGGKECC